MNYSDKAYDKQINDALKKAESESREDKRQETHSGPAAAADSKEEEEEEKEENEEEEEEEDDDDDDNDDNDDNDDALVRTPPSSRSLPAPSYSLSSTPTPQITCARLNTL